MPLDQREVDLVADGSASGLTRLPAPFIRRTDGGRRRAIKRAVDAGASTERHAAPVFGGPYSAG